MFPVAFTVDVRSGKSSITIPVISSITKPTVTASAHLVSLDQEWFADVQMRQPTTMMLTQLLMTGLVSCPAVITLIQRATFSA